MQRLCEAKVCPSELELEQGAIRTLKTVTGQFSELTEPTLSLYRWALLWPHLRTGQGQSKELLTRTTSEGSLWLKT